MKLSIIKWFGHAARISIRGMLVLFWWEGHNEKNHKEERNVERENNIKMYLRQISWTGLIWLSMGTIGRLLSRR
jgi:hypothetical protein